MVLVLPITQFITKSNCSREAESLFTWFLQLHNQKHFGLPIPGPHSFEGQTIH